MSQRLQVIQTFLCNIPYSISWQVTTVIVWITMQVRKDIMKVTRTNHVWNAKIGLDGYIKGRLNITTVYQTILLFTEKKRQRRQELICWSIRWWLDNQTFLCNDCMMYHHGLYKMRCKCHRDGFIFKNTDLWNMWIRSMRCKICGKVGRTVAQQHCWESSQHCGDCHYGYNVGIHKF